MVSKKLNRFLAKKHGSWVRELLPAMKPKNINIHTEQDIKTSPNNVNSLGI